MPESRTILEMEVVSGADLSAMGGTIASLGALADLQVLIVHLPVQEKCHCRAGLVGGTQGGERSMKKIWMRMIMMKTRLERSWQISSLGIRQNRET